MAQLLSVGNIDYTIFEVLRLQNVMGNLIRTKQRQNDPRHSALFKARGQPDETVSLKMSADRAV